MFQSEFTFEEQVERGVPEGAKATAGTFLPSSPPSEDLILEEFDVQCPDARPNPSSKARKEARKSLESVPRTAET
jgi:hypothetical protein